MPTDGGDQKGPLPKICLTDNAMMKHGAVLSYPKKIQKYMNHVTHYLSSADIAFFHWKSATLVIPKNTDKLAF